MQAAQGLRAIAAIVEQVAFRLNQHAAPVAGQQAHSQMVGQRAGGQPHRRFLTEQRGHARLQLLHHAAARVVVSLYRIRQGRQQLRVLRGSERNAVAESIHTRLGLGPRQWIRRRQWSGQKAPPLHESNHTSG